MADPRAVGANLAATDATAADLAATDATNLAAALALSDDDLAATIGYLREVAGFLAPGDDKARVGGFIDQMVNELGRRRGAANPGWAQYTHHDLHWALVAVACVTPVNWSAAQALFCPYYVPLEGRLGADWGVIVNPQSSRFGRLTFEHDDCGCPPQPDEDAEGYGRHPDAPEQQLDTWDVDWKHTCDDCCEPDCADVQRWG